MSQTPPPPGGFYLPPAPAVDLKPISIWVWVGTAVLVVALVGGSIAVVKSRRAQWQASDAAVAALHAKMLGADDAGIFADADQTYRDTVTAETSNGMFDKVRTRLGAPHHSRQLGSTYSTEDAMGVFLTLRYRTVFDKGSGNETICFHKLDGRWKLAAYNVESPLLQPAKPPVRLQQEANH